VNNWGSDQDYQYSSVPQPKGNKNSVHPERRFGRLTRRLQETASYNTRGAKSSGDARISMVASRSGLSSMSRRSRMDF
jgi:hypothetical protein